VRFMSRGLAFATAALFLVGCASDPGETPLETEVSSEVSETASVLELAVGTCVNDAETPLGADLAEVPAVSCDEPHDSELYAIVSATDGPYPGVDTLVGEGQDKCQVVFAEFVGIDFRSSLLDYHFYYPTPSSWAQGDRSIYCMVIDPGLKVIGTLQGAKR
jgi:Septum formation